METEKLNRDKQIDALNEDILKQDEAIAKLGKEKKGMEENIQELNETLQASEDKCNHLNKAKKKLEDSLKDVGQDFIQINTYKEVLIEPCHIYMMKLFTKIVNFL